MYNTQFGDPGTYIVTLSAAGLTRSTTVQVANVPPTIQAIAQQTGFTYTPHLTLNPTVIDPGVSDESGGLTYRWTLTKNNGTSTFYSTTTNSQSLTFAPDLPPAPAVPPPGSAPPPGRFIMLR